MVPRLHVRPVVPALGGIIKPYSGDVMAPFLPTGPDSYDLWTVGNLWS